MALSTLNRQLRRFIVDGGNVLYLGFIIDTTMFDLNWKVGNLDKEYKIDDDYEIMGYCSI